MVNLLNNTTKLTMCYICVNVYRSREGNLVGQFFLMFFCINVIFFEIYIYFEKSLKARFFGTITKHIFFLSHTYLLKTIEYITATFIFFLAFSFIKIFDKLFINL